MLLVFIGFYAVSYVSMIQHENVHAEIFKYYGCTDTEMDYHFSSATTTCKTPLTQETRDKMYNLHMQNEIVTYNNDAVIQAIFVCTAFIIFILFVLNEEKQ